MNNIYQQIKYCGYNIGENLLFSIVIKRFKYSNSCNTGIVSATCSQCSNQMTRLWILKYLLSIPAMIDIISLILDRQYIRMFLKSDNSDVPINLVHSLVQCYLFLFSAEFIKSSILHECELNNCQNCYTKYKDVKQSNYTI